MENTMTSNYDHTELRHRRWPRLLIALGFWALLILVYNPFNIEKDKQIEEYYSFNGQTTIGEISADVVYSQEFKSNYDNLSSVALYMGTYDRKNYGDLTVALLDEKGKMLSQCIMDVGDVTDGWVQFDFSRLKDTKGKTYTLTIKGDSNVGQGVTIMCGHTDSCKPTKIDGKASRNSIYFQLIYQSDEALYLKLGVWIVLFLFSLIFVLFPGKADEKTFLKLAVCFGIIIAILNPFPHMLDENTHFFRSFMVSQGDFIDELDRKGNIGGYVADNYDEMIGNRLSLETLVENYDFWSGEFHSNEEFFENPYMSSYVPINHALGAAGIWIGRACNLPVYLCVWFGRLTTLAFYIILCYFAIRKAKYYKSLFFTVAMIPLGLSLAASFSVDPILIASSLLFTSICWRFYFDHEQRGRWHDIVLLLICVTFIAASKYLIYCTVLLQYFLIPRKCYKHKISYFMVLLIMLLLVALMGITQMQLLGMFEYMEDRNGDVDMARQLQFLLRDIPRGLKILAQSFYNTLTLNVSCLTFYSDHIGIARLLGLLLVLAAALEPDKYVFESAKKMWGFIALMLFIICLSWAMTVGALYLAYSPVGSHYADGVQSRYLIPLLIMGLVPVSCIPFKNKMRNYKEQVAFITVLIYVGSIIGMATAAFK